MVVLVHVRAACFALAVVLGLAGCASHAPPGSAPYTDVPHTDITALELHKTSCFGTCPAFSARFTADGRAVYTGVRDVRRLGKFAGRVDFERIAAWVDSQQPDTLNDAYAVNVIDSPRVTVIVERGARRKMITTANEGDTPLRFQGIVLALDGELERIRWSPVDDLTPYAGTFSRGDITLYVDTGPRQSLAVSARLNPCGLREPPMRTVRVTGGVRILCEHRASTLRPVPAGLQAEGDAVPPGLYQRMSQREADRRAGLVPAPQAT